MFDAPKPSPEAVARAAERVAMLHALAALGMALAQAVTDQETQADAPKVAADPGLAFSRIARAVRLTLALEARFDEGQGAMLAEQAKARDLDRFINGIYRDEVRDRVHQSIESDRYDRSRELDVERLHAELEEKLTEYELEDFTYERTNILVREICITLGVTFDPLLWEDEDGIEPAERTEAPANAPPGLDWPPLVKAEAFEPP